MLVSDSSFIQSFGFPLRHTLRMGSGMAWRWRQFLLLLSLLLLLPLLISVLNLHRDSEFYSQSRNQGKNKKFDHIVLGPAPGRGFPNRLHCQGLTPLNKTHLIVKQRGLGYNEHVSFITVFTFYNRSISQEAHDLSSSTVTVGNTSYNKVERSLALLNTYINFIQVSMPRSDIVILTDPTSEFPMRNNVSVLPIQGDYSRKNLMLQRIKSYITFLETRLKENIQIKSTINHYIFTDSDIAVVGDLGLIFETYPNFDLALTFRNNKDQPLNSGFIAVRGTTNGITRAMIFLQEVLEVYKSRYMKAAGMLGDQLSLAWIIKSHPSFDVKRFTRQEAFSDHIRGVTVLFLPCAIYNWTPPEGAGQFHGMPLNIQVVHFKGSRKRLMLEAWNHYTSSGNISSMLCLILKSGRTKYDF